MWCECMSEEDAWALEEAACVSDDLWDANWNDDEKWCEYTVKGLMKKKLYSKLAMLKAPKSTHPILNSIMQEASDFDNAGHCEEAGFLWDDWWGCQTYESMMEELENACQSSGIWTANWNEDMGWCEWSIQYANVVMKEGEARKRAAQSKMSIKSAAEFASGLWKSQLIKRAKRGFEPEYYHD